MLHGIVAVVAVHDPGALRVLLGTEGQVVHRWWGEAAADLTVAFVFC
jgi:hypothetical protein